MRRATRVYAAGGACAQIRCRSTAARDLELRCVYLAAERIAEGDSIQVPVHVEELVYRRIGFAPNWAFTAGTPDCSD